MIRRRYCPESSSCEAPVCPLDPDWKQQTQLLTDPICYYLSGSDPIGDLSRVAQDAPSSLSEQVISFIINLNEHYGHDYIRSRLREAERLASNMPKKYPQNQSR
jgi:hypothetical protein